MKKSDIADYVVSKTDLKRSQAIEAVDSVFKAMSYALSKGENVYVRGFATIKIHKSPEKIARNIAKGTQILIPACRTVKIVVSPNLKKELNK